MNSPQPKPRPTTATGAAAGAFNSPAPNTVATTIPRPAPVFSHPHTQVVRASHGRPGAGVLSPLQPNVDTFAMGTPVAAFNFPTPIRKPIAKSAAVWGSVSLQLKLVMSASGPAAAAFNLPTPMRYLIAKPAAVWGFSSIGGRHV